MGILGFRYVKYFVEELSLLVLAVEVLICGISFLGLTFIFHLANDLYLVEIFCFNDITLPLIIFLLEIGPFLSGNQVRAVILLVFCFLLIKFLYFTSD